MSGLSRLKGALEVLTASAACLLLGPSGCANNDACQGRPETCVSVTLQGADGVSQTDELQVMVMRQPKPEMPMMPLGTPEPLPFKVAILWPDGPGTLSIRSFLQGQVNGVTAEITVDLSNGAHEQQLLTLFPPLVGSSLGDMWLPTPPDMTSTTDLSAPAPADLTVLPPEDLSTPTD